MRSPHSVTVDGQELLLQVLTATTAAESIPPYWEFHMTREEWWDRQRIVWPLIHGEGVAIGRAWLGTVSGMRRRRSRGLKRLQAQGLVKLTPAKRARFVALTDAGRAVAGEIRNGTFKSRKGVANGSQS